MSAPRGDLGTERWMEALLAAGDGPARQHAFVELLQERELASAIAIWRRGPGGASSWRAVLERGAVAALPRPEQVRLALSGKLCWSLPHRCAVLRAGDERRGIGLVLAELRGEAEEELDLLRGWLLVWLACEEGDPGLLEGLEGPLPRPGPKRSP